MKKGKKNEVNAATDKYHVLILMHYYKKKTFIIYISLFTSVREDDIFRAWQCDGCFMCSKIFFLLFLLQRHYFHCKNQFDITNLNSTYTQVSARISSSVVKARWKCVQLRCVYEWQIILITWAMCVCPQMQSKGLYKAMGELNLLFNYIETYLASKRHRNHVWRPADPNQSFFFCELYTLLYSVGYFLWCFVFCECRRMLNFLDELSEVIFFF